MRDGTRNSTAAADKPSFFFFAPPSQVPDYYSRLKLCLLSANFNYQKQAQILLSFLRRQPEGGLFVCLTYFTF